MRTIADLKIYMDYTLLRDVATEPNDLGVMTYTESIALGHLAAAEERVNSLLAKHTTSAERDASALVTQWICVYAMESLVARRGKPIDGLRQRVADADRQIAAIQVGQATLSATDVAPFMIQTTLRDDEYKSDYFQSGQFTGLPEGDIQ